ncbi:hypothetical protein DL764_010427 [Monosporascus ibericus]|uniref:Uncharacterized protein n=1 Tax=Monosporascus ibericus TaxID=155417 RepID=A0A4Q4SRH4_9PEZI|nr:hypothetical protein DL764_010427 [Monosporascus ibericus]
MVADPNVTTDRQLEEIPVSRDRYVSASVLVTSDVRSTTVLGNLTLVYDDNSTTTAEVRTHKFPWFLAIRRGEITFTAALDPEKTLSTVIFPNTTNATSGRLHAFALSLYKGVDVHVQSLRTTQKGAGEYYQVVGLLVNDAGTERVSGMTTSTNAPGVMTVQNTFVKRLCRGDQKRVDVAVEGQFNGTVEWTADWKSLVQHQVSQWWYSARINEHAAADRAGFYACQLQTFEPELNYDDFFADYTTSTWNPKERVDLFADVGLHNRSSMHYVPRRELLGELFDTAAEYQSHLQPGPFFSLSECSNPDWGQYGFTRFDHVTSTSRPGHLSPESVHGTRGTVYGPRPVHDFIAGLMVPHMDIRAYDYGTDIMWSPSTTGAGRRGPPTPTRPSTRPSARCNAASGRATRAWTLTATDTNRATPDEGYMNASTVMHNLIDMINENGNFLLEVTARADGSIVQVAVDNLRGPAPGSIRTPKPYSTSQIQAKVPAVEGDQVTALAMDGEIGLE